MEARSSVTMHDVAKSAGVSVQTVSNVINGYAYLRPSTRERVLKAIDELGYRVNVIARNLRQGRTGMIGLVLPELSLSYFAELADSVIRVADEVGLTVLIEQTGATRDHELGVLSGMRRELTDGLIFHPSTLVQQDVGALKVSYPLVLLGERIFGGPVDHVTMANVDGARAATEHLIARGRRRIALLGGPMDAPMGPSMLRMKGYREALEASTIPFDPALVAQIGPWHHGSGARAMRELLDSGVEIDAVFAMNDAMALGALHVLYERRIPVPTQIAVIGFDNTDEASYSIPSLSTIDPGHKEIARTAVNLLRERIEHPSDRPPQTVIPGFRLIERDSTC